jgi:hypothetical protein
MTRAYAEGKIKDALKKAGGNATKARQAIIAQAFEDPKLLHELMAPHMTGIVAHAINHVMAMKDKPTAPPPTPKMVDPSEKDAFGMEILKAIALGNPTQFGQESGAAPVKKQQASQRHVDAIKQMIAKGKTGK